MAEEKRRDIPQIFLWSLLVICAFLIGSLYTKVQYLEKGSKTTAGTTPQQPSGQAPTQSTVSLDQVKDAFNKSAIKFGDLKRKVLFIEVADPSCPYCHVAVGLNPELNKQVGDRFTLVSDGGSYIAPVPEMKKLVDSGKAALAWIYTPGHGNGEMGTKAMYCAFEKGKFWEVHDLLMTSKGYDLLNNTIKNDKAKSGELAGFFKSVFDSAQMKSCLDSGKYDERLAEDVKLASGIGITGTPGYYVNETNFAGAYSWKDMETAVNESLK